MANQDRDQLLKVANQLELKAIEALDRGLEFALIAGGDPASALADFEKAGSLFAAGQLCRQRADD